MTITQTCSCITFAWHSGNIIGAAAYLDSIILPEVKKIRYHVEVGASAYDSLNTVRFRPCIGVKSARYISGFPAANDTDWLVMNRYDSLNYSGDEELDLSSVTDVCYLMIGAHGCNVSFSNLEFVYE